MSKTVFDKLSKKDSSYINYLKSNGIIIKDVWDSEDEFISCKKEGLRVKYEKALSLFNLFSKNNKIIGIIFEKNNETYTVPFLKINNNNFVKLNKYLFKY